MNLTKVGKEQAKGGNTHTEKHRQHERWQMNEQEYETQSEEELKGQKLICPLCLSLLE